MADVFSKTMQNKLLGLLIAGIAHLIGRRNLTFTQRSAC